MAEQVPAASQVLAVLRYLASQAAPVSAGSVTRDLALPRSTTYHLLAELVRQGFAVHLPDQRRYGLGVTAYEIGHGWTRQASLSRLARGPVARLVTQTGCTAHLAVLHGREVVYVIEERAPHSAPLVSDVGVRLPAHLTATGRAILAALPPAHVRALFPDRGSFVSRHGVGPTSLPALRALLVDVRRRGWAVERGEVTPGLRSVATAVLDPAGHPVAAVAVTFDEETGTGTDVPARGRAHEGDDALARAVGATAADVRRRLGAG